MRLPKAFALGFLVPTADPVVVPGALVSGVSYSTLDSWECERGEPGVSMFDRLERDWGDSVGGGFEVFFFLGFEIRTPPNVVTGVFVFD